MKVIVVKPGEEPKVMRIGDSLEEMQAVVGGYIETVRPLLASAVLVCNEEGWLLDLPENRLGIRGTFFICGADGDDFTDVPGALVDIFVREEGTC